MLSGEQIQNTIIALTELQNSEKELLEKVAQLEAKIQLYEKAEELATKFFEIGYFPAERFSEKLAEYKTTSLNDLYILEKAAQLAETNPAIFGSLSGKSAPGSENPLLACLFEN